MHASSLHEMQLFVGKYLDKGKKLKILDVGSYDVNGSYKDLFNNSNWKYVGLDIQKGPNVDIVVKNLYSWNLKEKFDIVISGQCLEHVKDMQKWILQIKKVLKRNGLVCIIAPWSWNEHRFPVDCWRILPDGMRFLLEEVCGFKTLIIYKKERDCVGIAKFESWFPVYLNFFKKILKRIYNKIKK